MNKFTFYALTCFFSNGALASTSLPVESREELSVVDRTHKVISGSFDSYGSNPSSTTAEDSSSGDGAGKGAILTKGYASSKSIEVLTIDDLIKNVSLNGEERAKVIERIQNDSAFRANVLNVYKERYSYVVSDIYDTLPLELRKDYASVLAGDPEHAAYLMRALVKVKGSTETTNLEWAQLCARIAYDWDLYPETLKWHYPDILNSIAKFYDFDMNNYAMSKVMYEDMIEAYHELYTSGYVKILKVGSIERAQEEIHLLDVKYNKN